MAGPLERLVLLAPVVRVAVAAQHLRPVAAVVSEEVVAGQTLLHVDQVDSAAEEVVEVLLLPDLEA